MVTRELFRKYYHDKICHITRWYSNRYNSKPFEGAFSNECRANFECLMGLAAKHLNTRFKVVPFDEMHGTEASPVAVHKKLQTASVVNDWLFSPQYP